MPEPPVGWFWPQNKAECHTASKASAGISAPFDTDDCGPGEMLSPSHSTQEKVSTSLACHNGKIPLYFNMPWAPPIKAAAFHSNPLNVTDTVAMTQCFPYAVMLMKRIDHRYGCGGLSVLASPQTPCSALLRTWGQVIKAGDRSFLSCLVLHTGPASSLELELSHAPEQAGWRPFFVGYSSLPPNH